MKLIFKKPQTSFLLTYFYNVKPAIKYELLLYNGEVREETTFYGK